MSFFSSRLDRIKLSPSTAATQRARELRAQGRDIIALTIGQPDFDTPQHVKRAVNEALVRNETKYPPIDGIPELKEAARRKFQRENALEYKTDQIMVGTGSKQIIFNAMMATIGPGDEAIIPAPYWISYLDMVLVSDGVPVEVQCTPESGFKLMPQQLEAAITPRTKWLLLNSPNNPTGAVYSRAEIRALADVLLRHPHVWILTDDIYEHLRFDGIEFATIAQVEPGLYDRTLTVNGVSKAYAMTGFRLGYAAGPKELIRNIIKLQSQSTAGVSSISQWAAVEALNGPQEFIPERAAAFQARRDRVLEMFKDIPGLQPNFPEGAFYLFVRCGDLYGRTTPQGKVLKDEQDVVLHLMDHGVAVVLGAAYGMSPYFRMSIATDIKNLEEACRRMQRAVAELK
ncbi:MAG TPA: pyridoxal phosphate-dependent aminotransferase [Burkholderiales bacterium]|nr:pyridoxal phosphate-dependent aminotransferase [Burkholderiales bacterium]